MKLAINCTLCNSKAALYHKSRQKKYYKCSNCLSLFLDPNNYLSREKEKARYEEHNNDVDDSGYQRFVSPIVNEIKLRYNKNHKGLDFGAGTGPVITKLLQDEGFSIELYDPFFWNNAKVLRSTYDYIICCEVIEHFHFPQKEFTLLRSLLKPGGVLYCMTEIYSEDIDFQNWYYKNDFTHVFFYHRNALKWIQEHFHFSGIKIKGRLIEFVN